ncbi:MAG: hypothetical protein HAW67_00645 [Endozoicomonadaceae bacterium]|nr:hypothetical protein [Endozoicomonadaceae bacterium]
MNNGQLQINELTAILNEHFHWNKARMGCFVGMLIALMVASTVNLTQLALFFPSTALVSSRYRRIQRFFSEHWLDYNEMARFIMKLFVFPVIAFCWSHKVGEWKNDCVLPIKTKTHQRPAQSIFRYGLDCIRSELFNVFSQSKKQVRKILSLLRPALSGNRIYGESVRC